MEHLTKCSFGAVAGLLITMLTSAAGHCCYSGLLVIPTASTVGAGQYSCEYQTDGIVKGIVADTHFFNNQFGIGDRLELGVDVDLDSQCSRRVLGNGKYVLCSKPGAFAAAVGVANLAHRWRAAPYLVADAGTRFAHLHFGVMSIDGNPCCILGMDRQFGKLTLMCDYTSGSEGVSSVGFDYQIKDNFGVMAGALFPNDSSDTGFTLHLVWSKSLNAKS